jgi:hypothetical protein
MVLRSVGKRTRISLQVRCPRPCLPVPRGYLNIIAYVAVIMVAVVMVIMMMMMRARNLRFGWPKNRG